MIDDAWPTSSEAALVHGTGLRPFLASLAPPFCFSWIRPCTGPAKTQTAFGKVL